MKKMRLFILMEVLNMLSVCAININNQMKGSPNILSNINRNNVTMINKINLKDDFSTNIFKEQVINELKSSEDVLKNILFKIINHFYEFVKYRLVNSFYRFYVINPFNIQLGNLLNTQLNNYYLTTKLHLPLYSTPLSYGINYEQVNVNEVMNVSSNSWLIKSTDKNCRKAFVLMHGWFGNLQSLLPFLNLLNQMNILNNYHVLVLNLYNSNCDGVFESNVGLSGVRRLRDALLFLKKNFNVDSFSVYAQSISALSTLLFVHSLEGLKSESPEPGRTLQNSDALQFMADLAPEDSQLLASLNVDHLVLESPVADVRNYIYSGPGPNKYYNQLLLLTNVNNYNNYNVLNEYINKLNLSTYLNNKEVADKVFLLFGLNDEISDKNMLKAELKKVKKLPKLFVFRKSGHGDMCVRDSTDYARSLNYILNRGRLLKFFLFNRNQVKSLNQF